MKKKVGFICVHNSCRSQIAEALAKKYGGDFLEVYSAGTELAPKINQDAVRIMKDLYGIDMEVSQKPKRLAEIPTVDYFISMGCNVVCPVKEYTIFERDWGLEDPSGKGDAAFLATIKEIEKKVLDLIEEVK